MIAAPAVTRFVGAGGYEDALNTSNEMTEITIDRNPNYIIPNWNFRGTCLGIDARLVVEKGITRLSTPVSPTRLRDSVRLVPVRYIRRLKHSQKAVLAYAKKLGLRNNLI